MSAALNVILTWKGGKRSPAHKLESNDGVDITTKRIPIRFRGDYYCIEDIKEEYMKPIQEG